MDYWQKSLFILLLPNLAFASVYFPKNQINVGYANQQFIHYQLPKPPKPFFWNSRFKAQNGFTLHYLRLAYHTQRHFSVNFGFSVSCWQFKPDRLFALSGFFELRWWLFRTRTFNPYLLYSIAGPTFLSRKRFAHSKLGGYFLFQDYMGIGFMIGEKQHISIEIKTVHYSNGDLAVDNQGLQVSFLLSIGYAFS